MKIKILTATFVALALALAWSWGSVPSAAQSPEPTPSNDSPFTAMHADFRQHRIPAGAALWYMFNYGGGNKPIDIIIPNGGLIGLEFRVYTWAQAYNPVEDKFVGRGTRPMVRCEEGRCASPDLTWRGAFQADGIYFVLVINPTNVWRTFSLFITGENVWHGIPTPTPGLQSVVASSQPPVVSPTMTGITPFPGTVTVTPPAPTVPTPTPTRVVENDSPFTAVYVRDNREQTIPAQSDMWYKFDYGGDKSRVMIVLYDGNVSGVWFAVFDPYQAINFTENRFVGRGTPQPVLCEQGSCTGNDLVWVGSFPVAGTYFIRVTNPNDKPWKFKLHIEGSNINIIE